jgi:hypothetical protein
LTDKKKVMACLNFHPVSRSLPQDQPTTRYSSVSTGNIVTIKSAPVGPTSSTCLFQSLGYGSYGNYFPARHEPGAPLDRRQPFSVGGGGIWLFSAAVQEERAPNGAPYLETLLFRHPSNSYPAHPFLIGSFPVNRAPQLLDMTASPNGINAGMMVTTEREGGVFEQIDRVTLVLSLNGIVRNPPGFFNVSPTRARSGSLLISDNGSVSAIFNTRTRRYWRFSGNGMGTHFISVVEETTEPESSPRLRLWHAFCRNTLYGGLRGASNPRGSGQIIYRRHSDSVPTETVTVSFPDPIEWANGLFDASVGGDVICFMLSSGAAIWYPVYEPEKQVRFPSSTKLLGGDGRNLTLIQKQGYWTLSRSNC